MDINDISLEINPFGWNLKQQRLKSKAFLEIKTKFIAYKDNTCDLCNYKSKAKYLSVVNKNGNYRDNKGSNFNLACSICTACHFIGSYQSSSDTESVDRLIYCPEISQVQLNQMYRVLFVAMESNNSKYKDIAKSFYRSLRHRANLVDKMFGDNSSDCRIFLQSVMDSNLLKSTNIKKVLKYLRFFPGRSSFREEWAVWEDDLLLDDYAKILFINV